MKRSICLLAGALACSAFAVPAAAALDCAALAGALIEDTRITLAVLNPATATAPEHCEVTGAINQRVSRVDGQTYVIKFHLRLPSSWNQRFFYTGGGGTDGNLGSALTPQLAQGYAVVSSDSGHDNALNTSVVAGNFQFGFDPQARSDYGYNGPAEVAVKAKALIKEYYGRKPKYSYFVGCSEGGREALMLSQRYPDFFDGIVAGNPGMDLPKAALAHPWDAQAFARAARKQTPFGNPDLASSFTDAELAAVGAAIRAACDADDGLADDMVLNPAACEFNPATLGPAGSGVLSQAQVTALKQTNAGPRNSHGRQLYSNWMWDPGIGAFGWRQWKIGPIAPGFPIPGNSALIVTLGGGALPFIFTTPPNSSTAGTDLAPPNAGIVNSSPLGPGTAGFGDAYMQWILSFNMDHDAPKIFADTRLYRESALDFMFSSGTDYGRFGAKGNKLIVYTGGADPVFSANYHLKWYRNLVARNDGLERTQKFARLFVVPGMNHCGGGPSTSQFDAFSAVVDWVENGHAPDTILGTAPATGTPFPGRTRPLCPYPAFAKYKGEGSIELAASFECHVDKHRGHNDGHDDEDDDHPGHGR
jgi:pimeloyl-ACP methyl ester carboxylesterase